MVSDYRQVPDVKKKQGNGYVLGKEQRKMKDFTLSQQYAMIGLDGQDCLHGSMAKSAAVRAIAAAKLLETLMEEKEPEAWTADPTEFECRLDAGLTEVRHLKKKEAKIIEHEMAEVLKADGVLDIVPDLLGCDMNYYTAGVEMKAYRIDQPEYLHISEGVRAEILEEGAVTEECICLLWLLRESGCIHEIFSVKEQEQLQTRMLGISAANDIYRILWQKEFHDNLESMVNTLLSKKRNLFKNPYLEGVNLAFPFLERRQAIFVDFVIFGTSVAERRQAMEVFLSEQGHYVEEVKNGTEMLLKIDNMYYRIWPKTKTCRGIPIQGANLVPVYW